MVKKISQVIGFLNRKLLRDSGYAAMPATTMLINVPSTDCAMVTPYAEKIRFGLLNASLYASSENSCGIRLYPPELTHVSLDSEIEITITIGIRKHSDIRIKKRCKHTVEA